MSAPFVAADVPDSAIIPHPDGPGADENGVDLTHPFGCFDCKFRSDYARKMAKHCTTTGHRRIWPCVPCAVRFPSREELDRHRAEVDIPAHRYCGRAPCNTVFPTIELYRAHFRDNHDFLPPLVSPEVQKVRKGLASQVWEISVMDEEKKIWAWEVKKKRKQLRAKERRRQMAERRQALLKMGPVECHLCSREFGTPAGYAMHLESGTHHDVNRHTVTQAVHMLDVIPPITIAASIEYQTAVEIESPASSSISPFTSVPSSPQSGDMEGSWIILREGSAFSRSVTMASSVSSTTLDTEASPRAFDAIPPLDPVAAFIPNGFVELGIPHGCLLCSKTFQTASRLAAHMNSPAHDPDAFKCPNPTCGQHFALVSGLIQHLESGTCNLASAAEIFERFALLTARFSRYLTA